MNFAPALDRDVDVGGRADAAVDQLAAPYVDGPVDHRQGRGGGDRLRDRHVVPVRRAEHDPLAGVQVGRGEVELRLQQAEIVSAIALAEDLADVLLDPGPGVDAGRQALRQAGHDVHHGDLAPPARETPREADQPQRHQHRPRGEVGVVGPQQRPEVDVLEGRGDLLVDDPGHLFRGHAGRQEARHERAGARADVDVEVVDRPVDAQEVERAERPDLVDAAGEAATAEHQRGAGPAPDAVAASCSRCASGPRAPFGVASSSTTSPTVRFIPGRRGYTSTP